MSLFKFYFKILKLNLKFKTKLLRLPFGEYTELPLSNFIYRVSFFQYEMQPVGHKSVLNFFDENIPFPFNASHAGSYSLLCNKNM